MGVFLALCVSSPPHRGIDGAGDACYLQVQLLHSLRRRPGSSPSWTSAAAHEAPSVARDLVIRQSNAERRLPSSEFHSHCKIPAPVPPEVQG